jgi:hypothetical protein
MWVIEIATGNRKRIKAADFIAQWLDDEPKYEKDEKSIDKQK